jgi:hypothetical protein
MHSNFMRAKEGPKYIRTKIELARQLQITRGTLDSYLSLPGAPRATPGQGWDLGRIIDFVAGSAESTRAGAKVDPSFEGSRPRS